MKTLFSLLFASLFTLSVSAQTVWIVDNRPSAPTGVHIFSQINDAVAAATSGDIIHVIPSSISYDQSLIDKNGLTIYGIGFNPDKEIATQSRVQQMTIATGVSDTRISGLYFVDNGTDLIIGNADGSISNIFIENCLFDGQISGTTAGASNKNIDNVVIRNCVVGQDLNGINDYAIDLVTEANANNVLITNNVIMGYINPTASLNVRNAIIRNNLFLGDDSNDLAFHFITTSTVSNNIFYGRAPRLDGNGGAAATNTTFTNNISFGNTDNSFVTGAGVIIDPSNDVGVDPLLTFSPQDTWDFAFDPTPQAGSPALLAGNDGTDIGLTGSTIPFSTTGSPLPLIKVLRLPEIIQEGTDVDATIEAEGN